MFICPEISSSSPTLAFASGGSPVICDQHSGPYPLAILSGSVNFLPHFWHFVNILHLQTVFRTYMAIIIRCSKASIAPVLFLNVFPENTSIVQISEISSVFTIPIAAYAFKLRIPFTGTAVFLFFASYAIIQNIHHSPLLICFFCLAQTCHSPFSQIIKESLVRISHFIAWFCSKEYDIGIR